VDNGKYFKLAQKRGTEKMSQKKSVALITGITGMVGSHLLDFLLENTDWKIWGLARWRSPMDNISDHFKQMNEPESRVNLIYGDLNDSASLISAIEKVEPNYVFHLAAQSFPKTSFAAPLDTLSTNVLGTAALLEAIKGRAPEAIVHVCSSSEVFGRVPKDRIPIKENENFHPASPYAISKAGTDLLGRFYAEAYGLNTQTTRMFTHTGPRRGDVFAESSFAKQIALAESGHIAPIIKVGNLDSLRTIADVRDAVKAYYQLVTHNPIPGAYYNIGGTHTCTVGEILQTLFEFSSIRNLKFEIDQERLRPIDADLQIPDTSAFTAHTGWKPSIPYEQTMLDLLNYWREKIAITGTQLVR
jgi:GDPmannose 4,6-dehydratase